MGTPHRDHVSVLILIVLGNRHSRNGRDDGTNDTREVYGLLSDVGLPSRQ